MERLQDEREEEIVEGEVEEVIPKVEKGIDMRWCIRKMDRSTRLKY